MGAGALACWAASRYSEAGRPSTGKLRGGGASASARDALARAEMDMPFHAVTTCAVLPPLLLKVMQVMIPEKCKTPT